MKTSTNLLLLLGLVCTVAQLTLTADVDDAQLDRGRARFIRQDNPENWALRRIANRRQFTDFFRYPESAGQGADVFVLGFGLPPHKDLDPKRITNFPGAPLPLRIPEEFPVGLSASGLIGSDRFGVAKKANVFNIQTAGFLPNGTLVGDVGDGDLLVKGIDLVAKYAKDKKKTVIAMMPYAFFGPLTNDLTVAFKNAINSNVLIVAPVYFSDEEPDIPDLPLDGVCSDVSIRDKILLVGGTSETGQAATKNSNPECIKIFAPEKNVTTTAPNDTTAAAFGFVSSTALTAGAAALVLGENPKLSAQEVIQIVLARATPNAVVDRPKEAANKFLYTGPGLGL